MRHPIEQCNLNQAEALASLPEDKREWMAQMFRIGNASYCYFHQSTDLTVFSSSTQPDIPEMDLLDWLEQQIQPTIENQTARELLSVYWEEFLAGLPDDQIRTALKAAGLEKGKTIIPFRRYVLERYDLGMDEFLKLNLSSTDYAFHKSNGEHSAM